MITTCVAIASEDLCVRYQLVYDKRKWITLNIVDYQLNLNIATKQSYFWKTNYFFPLKYPHFPTSHITFGSAIAIGLPSSQLESHSVSFLYDQQMKCMSLIFIWMSVEAQLQLSKHKISSSRLDVYGLWLWCGNALPYFKLTEMYKSVYLACQVFHSLVLVVSIVLSVLGGDESEGNVIKLTPTSCR